MSYRTLGIPEYGMTNACIGHSLFEEHYKVGYDTAFVALALLYKLMSISLGPFLYYPFWGCCQG